jgi:hypothetical protein
MKVRDHLDIILMRASARTGSAVSPIECKYQNISNLIGPLMGPVTKQFAAKVVHGL